MSKIAFVYLPFVAPMMPPLSIPVLTAFLEKNNIETESYDLNIELYRYMLQKDVVMSGFDTIENEYNLLYVNKKIDNHDKKRIRLLCLMLKRDYVLDNLETAGVQMSPGSDICTHKELFWTAKVISTALQAAFYGLAYLSSENPMSFTFDTSYSDTDNIFKDKSWGKVILWFIDRIAAICKDKDYLCFSLCYDNQIYFMLWLAEYIKSNYPDKKIVIGGPVVSAIIKHSTTNFESDFLEKNASLFDAAIVGDGEYPLLDYFNSISNSNVFLTPYKNVECLLCDERKPPLLVPKFEDLPLNLYLTPQLTLPLITARHCYWRKCRFCTHSVGYSQYIKYSDNEIIMCMEQLITKLGVRGFYFVDECMAPSTAYGIADWVINNCSQLKWMTDMRFENLLTDKKYVEHLAAGGCKYIAFGMESANDRVLECMNKGITREKISRTIDNCHMFDISVTLMFFFGFPTETADEAKDTFQFVLDNIDKIGGIGMGSFTLMPGSYVYQHYREFGIEYADNDGNYRINKGMNSEEVYEIYKNCNEYIAKNFYRGHLFYHRLFYLLELGKEDKNEYPIGITHYNNIIQKNKSADISKISKVRLNNGILYKRIADTVIVSDFYDISEKMYFIKDDIFGQILLLCNDRENNLMDEYKELLLKTGVIRYEE